MMKIASYCRQEPQPSYRVRLGSSFFKFLRPQKLEKLAIATVVDKKDLKAEKLLILSG